MNISGSDVLLTNDVDEGPVCIYASFIARQIKGIHKVVIADIRSILEKKISDAQNSIRLLESVPVTGPAWMRRNNTIADIPDLVSLKLYQFIIIEGNHRAVAYDLFAKKIPCTLVENDEDLAECIELSEQGKMGRFVHEETSLEQIIENGLPVRPQYRHTVSEYTNRALERSFSLDKWPRYLREKILESRNKS